jgi:hypothetical protein
VPGKLLAGLTAGSCALGQPDYELAYARQWVSVSKEYALLAAAACRILGLRQLQNATGRQFPASRCMAVSTGMKGVFVQVHNGDARYGIGHELVLSLKGQDEPTGVLAEHEGQA